MKLTPFQVELIVQALHTYKSHTIEHREAAGTLASIFEDARNVTTDGEADEPTPLLDAAIARQNPRRHRILKG